jgi:hypothetical protein
MILVPINTGKQILGFLVKALLTLFQGRAQLHLLANTVMIPILFQKILKDSILAE